MKKVSLNRKQMTEMLHERISDRLEITKTATSWLVDEMYNIIADAIKTSEKVALPGIGSFKKVARSYSVKGFDGKTYKGRTKSITFKPSRKIKVK